LASAKAASDTANQRYRSFQQFFRWPAEEGEIRDNPSHDAHTPAHDPRGPGASRQRRGLRALVATSDGSREGRCDEAILRIFIDTGARLAEVAGLRVGSHDGGDVDLDGRVLRVLGKGRRQRLIGMGPRTGKAIDRYLRRRAQHPRAAEPWLWLGTKGHMTGSGIRQMIWRRSRAAGIERIHPHPRSRL
jgi:site-specific recombinase XerD